ncbi:MAG: Hsp70 family protein [Candidatus Cloacimonetes bacterium]|nr:Hsp70 family protein [Candidatus Cloacimonadota bacterium]
MICKKCGYPDNRAFNFCPLCGTAQLELSFTQPGFAVLGEAFFVKFHIKGSSALKLRSVSYSGIELLGAESTIKDGNNLRLSIEKIPTHNNKTMLLDFVDFPIQSFNLELLNPETLSLRVQDLYELPVFNSKTEDPLVTFSYYEEFFVEFTDNRSFFKMCSLELHIHDFTIVALNKGDKLVIPKEAFEGFVADNPVPQSCNLILKYQNNYVASKQIMLMVNKIPKFDILPPKELENAIFNLANPKAPMAELCFNVVIGKTSAHINKVAGSDLEYFSVKSTRQCLRVENRKRFEHDADLKIQLQYVPGVLSETDFAHLRAEKTFHFGIELEIKGNSFPYSIIKHYKYAMVVEEEMEYSSFAVIDFGTTNSCLIDDTGSFVLSAKGLKEHKSLISFKRFGADIYSHEYLFPENDTSGGSDMAFNFKSLLMRDAEKRQIYTDGKQNYFSFTPIELTQIYLSELINRIQNYTQKQPREIVATYPAIFNKSTRNTYLDIFRSLDYRIIEDACMTEPEAIAYYYLMENELVKSYAIKNKEVTVGIFDCGGGTTDYAIVSYNAVDDDMPLINVAASWGTQKFNGIYLSYALAKCKGSETQKIPDKFDDIFGAGAEANHFRNQFTYYEQEKIKQSQEMANDKNLRDAIQKLAKSLDSSSEYFKVFAGGESNARNADIFSIQNQMSRINEVIMGLYENGQIRVPYVDFIILAGNSCRLPLFRLYAEQEFGKDKVLLETESIKTSVARGAYIYRSRGGEIVFQGLNRSTLKFFIYSSLNEERVLFKRWLDMDEEHSCKLRFPAHRKLPIAVHYSKVEEKPALAFEISPPVVKATGKITLCLKYYAHKIYSKWQYVEENGREIDSPWKLELDHE